MQKNNQGVTEVLIMKNKFKKEIQTHFFTEKSVQQKNTLVFHNFLPALRALTLSYSNETKKFEGVPSIEGANVTVDGTKTQNMHLSFT